MDGTPGPERRDHPPEIAYRPIGVVRTPWTDPEGTPIQPPGAEGVEGTVEVDPALADGLAGLEGFSHVILIYHCHRAGEARLRVTPFLDDETYGVFAVRAPSRPNPIGVSVVRLEAVDGNLLRIRDVDIVDGTPLLDIKPYVPAFDAPTGVRTGWLRDAPPLDGTRDDGRFAE